MVTPTQAWLDWLKGMELPSKHNDESPEQWTNRIHKSGAELGRFRQCSIGWHDECSDRQGDECKCPCHDMDKGRLASACRELEGELSEARSRRVWHKFDKDDPSTWPIEKGMRYWVSRPVDSRLPGVRKEDWVGSPEWFWNHVTHWMPLEMPEPPQ